MEVIEAIRGRASTRAFLEKPVPQELLEQVLEAARWAPSGVNTQPWKVWVVSGSAKQTIGDEMLAARAAGEPKRQDYRYYAEKLVEPYRSRQKACGLALYGALGIAREDQDRRVEQWNRNYIGFGAPVELFVFVEAALEKGSWVDTGMFIQNIMLAARGCGLETCPQAAMAEYPDIVRRVLGIPDSLHLICGIAVGYRDASHPVNQYRTDREPLASFVSWQLE